MITGRRISRDTMLAIAVLSMSILIWVSQPSLTEASTYKSNGEWAGMDHLTFPSKIAINSTGDVLVFDRDNPGVVQWFTSDGTVLGSFDGLAPVGVSFDAFINDIAVDSTGDIYVSNLSWQEDEYGDPSDIECRIQKFSPTGTLITFTTACGFGIQLDVDASGNVGLLDVADQFVPSRIQLESIEKQEHWAASVYVVRIFDGQLNSIEIRDVPDSEAFAFTQGDLTVAEGWDFFRNLSPGDNCVRWIDGDRIQCWELPGTVSEINALVAGSGESVFSGGYSPGGGIAKVTKWAGVIAKNIGGNLDAEDLALDPSGNIWAVAFSNSGRYITSYSPVDAASVRVWPRQAGAHPYDSWAKIGGSVNDVSGDPIAGAGLFLQSRPLLGPSRAAVPDWEWNATVYSDQNGYFQNWFIPTKSREYRAVYQATNTLASNTFAINVLPPRISVWNPHSSITYGGWTRIHGLIGDGQGGPSANETVYLQVWDYATLKWVWRATANSTSTGYFDFWFKPYGTTRYRVVTRGSATYSEVVEKLVKKKVTMWPSSWTPNFGRSVRVAIEIQPRHPGSSAQLREWNTAQQEWVLISDLTLNASSKVVHTWKPTTKGWHALRVDTSSDWDHKAGTGPVRWVNVR